jgi:hypothetical protein
MAENENSMRNILYSLPFSLYSLLISHLFITVEQLLIRLTDHAGIAYIADLVYTSTHEKLKDISFAGGGRVRRRRWCDRALAHP